MTDVAIPRGGVPQLTLARRFSSDERLAALVARGDAHAFTLLYERHRGALYRYCRSIVRNEEDAQDALQSAVMRALVAMQTSERDIAVRPWLFRIVHNEAVSLLRRRRDEDRPIDEREVSHGNVERAVEDRERLAMLVADLQALGERQRAALIMRELSGLSIEEIAAALSTSPGAAKQALFEARCALHELAEGRAMECETVRRTLSERDGRVLRGRKLRAHLRACAGCVQFRALIETRGADLRALVPLPTAAAIGIIGRAAEMGAGHVGEAAAVPGASLGVSTTVGFVAKALAGAAIVSTATGGAAHLVGVGERGRSPRPASDSWAPVQGLASAPATAITHDARRIGTVRVRWRSASPHDAVEPPAVAGRGAVAAPGVSVQASLPEALPSGTEATRSTPPPPASQDATPAPSGPETAGPSVGHRSAAAAPA
ncbi:MAG: sigma-70 family RNA polymerase sigma factor, partial [Conexibacter sp.]